MRAILAVNPDAVFIQSESSEYFHADGPSSLARADLLNERRFVALDLSYGVPVNVLMYQYLLDNGMTREEYEWFGRNHVRASCVMGNDYYITNEHLVAGDGATRGAGEIFGYYVITRQYFERYRLPVMHTETNIHDVERAPDWLRKQWANVLRLRQDGVTIVGFTWYIAHRSGGLGLGAARGQRTRESVRALRHRSEDQARGRGLPAARLRVARHSAHRELRPQPRVLSRYSRALPERAGLPAGTASCGTRGFRSRSQPSTAEGRKSSRNV